MRFGVALLLGVCLSVACAQQFTASYAELDQFFSSAFNDAHLSQSLIASAAVAVVKRDGTIVYQKGFGSQNIGGSRTTSDKTIFRLASVSKTLAATVGCQLLDSGAVDVHADMNLYLSRTTPPCPVAAEIIGNYTSYAAKPVLPTSQPLTLFNAMTQTMGLDSPGQQGTINILPNRMPMPAYYACCAPKRIRPASSIITYSNHGIGYIGVVAEGVTGVPYELTVQNQIFNRIGMTNSYPMLTTQLMSNPNFQQNLQYNPHTNITGPYPIIGMSAIRSSYSCIEVIPAGDASATAEDMAKFVSMWLNNGTYAPTNTQILSPEVVQAALTTQFRSDPRLPGLGYVWWMCEQNGLRFAEHDGNLPGFNNRVRFYPDQGVGLVLLTNSQPVGFQMIARLANDFQNTFVSPFPCNGTGQVYTDALGCVSSWHQVPLAMGPQADAMTRYAYLAGEYVKYRFSRLTWLRFGGWFKNRVTVGPLNGYVQTTEGECWVERTDGSFYTGFALDTGDCAFVIPFDSSWVRVVRMGEDGRANYLMSQVSVLEQMPAFWGLMWIAVIAIFAAVFVLDILVIIPVQFAFLRRWHQAVRLATSSDLDVSLVPLEKESGGESRKADRRGDTTYMWVMNHLLFRLITNVFFIANAVPLLLGLPNAPGIGEGDGIRAALSVGVAGVVFLFLAMAVLLFAMCRAPSPIPPIWIAIGVFIALAHFFWIFCLVEWNFLGAYWDAQP